MEMNPFSPVLSLELFQRKLSERMIAFQKQVTQHREPGSEEKVDDEKEDGAAVATEQSVKALLSSGIVSDLAVEKSRRDIEALFHAVTFIQILTGALPILSEMFLSKTATDATECVSFFVVAKEFSLSAPKEAEDVEADVKAKRVTVDTACARMGGLIWSKEAGTREAVLAAWQRLYFHPDLTASRGSPQQKKAALVSVDALLKLVLSSTLSDLTSLEEILTKLFYAGAIPPCMIDQAWELFASENSTSTARAGLLTMINFISNASGHIISSHAQELVEVGLSVQALTQAPHLVRATCIALQKWQAGIKAAITPAAAPPALSERTLAIILQRFEVLLQHTAVLAPKAAQAWYSMAEQVVNTIFILSTAPEIMMESICHKLAPSVFEPSVDGQGIGNAEKLSRFLFLLAHTAMKTLTHLEHMEKDIKAMRSKANSKPQIETERIGLDEEQPKKKAAPKKQAVKKGKKKTADSEEEEVDVEEVEIEEEAPAKKRGKNASAAAASAASVSSIEDDLASTAAAEYELEQRRELAEAALLSSQSSANSLLATFGPIVEAIVTSLLPGPTYGQFAAHPTLLANGVLALCKFMTIHVDYCESHLRLLFSALTTSGTDATIKGNIIIALGDLFLRFPNSIEPYSEYMYHGLKKGGSKKVTPADEVYVRKNTLMVLTHLILNDMLKAKGPIAEIAKCTQDFSAHPRIAELSQCFFQELNQKTGDSKATIYNILPDILSRLSGDSTVSEAHFQSIFKFLLSFISKDKQIENLIEKLIHRFEFVYVEPVAPTITPEDAVKPVTTAVEKLQEGDAESAVTGGAEIPAEADPVLTGGEPVEIVAPSPSSVVSSEPLSAQEVSLKQCRDLSYCLTQLPFSLVSLKKLVQLFRCYSAKLGDQHVYAGFMSILAKAKKAIGTSAKGEGVSAASVAKEKDAPEMKAICDELEVKYAQAYEKLVEEARTTAKAKNARGKKGYGEKIAGEEEAKSDEGEHESAIAAPLANKKGKPKAPAKKAPAKSRRKKVESEDEVEEEEEVESEVSEVEEDQEEGETRPTKKPAPLKKAPKKAAPAKGGRRKKVADSEDEDE